MRRKTTIWTLQATNKQNLTVQNFDMAKRETESFSDSNTKQRHMKQLRQRKNRQDATKLYTLCVDREETITHIIIKCSKLAQREYKTRHDWVGKMIP